MIASLAVVATLAAEALAIYTVGELVAATYPDERSTAAISPFVILALTMMAFALPRVVAALLPRGRAAHAVTGAATFLAVYGSFRIEFAGDLAVWDFAWIRDFIAHGVETVELPRPVTGALIIVFAWVRATWRSLTDVEFESTPRQLAGPAGIVIIASILGAASPHDELIARGAVAFLAVALVALAFSQSALSGATFGDVRAGGITTTLLAVSALASIAMVVGVGIAFDVLAGPIADVLAGVARLIFLITVAPIVVAAQWFVGLFDFDAAVFNQPESDGDTGEQPEDETSERGTVERWVLGLLRVAGVSAGLVTLAGLILLFMGRWRRYRRAAAADLEVSASGSLAEDLGSLFGGLFRRRRDGGGAESGDRVVRLYQRILRAARELGHERAPGQTPAEFAPELRAAFVTPVTDDVTHALEADLYGSRVLPEREIADLEDRWENRRL